MLSLLSKLMVAETIVKKNPSNSCIINQKIAQKLIRKDFYIWDCIKAIHFQLLCHSLSSMTFTLNMILDDFLILCLGMLKQSGKWLFQSGMKIGFIAQNFEKTQYPVLEGEEHKLSSAITFFATIEEPVRCRVKIITMDMFSPLL